MIIEQLERDIQIAIHAYGVDLKVLNEKATELWEENEKHKGDILYNDKANENVKIIIKIEQEMKKQKKELVEYIKEKRKEIEERKIDEENDEADFLKKLYNNFSGEDMARKRLYKKLGIEE